MKIRPWRSLSRIFLSLLIMTIFLVSSGCTKKPTAAEPASLNLPVSVPFRFVAYGDARFHDPKDTDAANPTVRVALVRAVANANPAFICFSGDLVYRGFEQSDWKVWDSETSPWREKKIPVLPAIGNHELYGIDKFALRNYFQRFPELNNSRYYSARAANVLIFVLDSAFDETNGPQGEWLKSKLDSVPPDIDFVFIVLHHPPYTSSVESMTGEGHSARNPERDLAKLLEARQAQARFRFVVVSGHVHNYERHEHGGITYFVSGGAGAHAYPISRAPDDPYQSKEINYHYLLIEVDHAQLKVTMNRLQIEKGKEIWTQPDAVKITTPVAQNTVH